MDALSLYLPTWPTDRARRRLPPDSVARRAPILLTAIERERTLVTACCAVARAAGVNPGMPLAQARALFRRPLHIEPCSPADDRRDLHRLALWAYRFAPIIALDGQDGLFIGAHGCAHLYRGIDRLAHQLLRRLHRAGITARLAAAPTFASAWALARFAAGPAPILVHHNGLDQALAPLPITALRLAPESIDALHAVGVERIGQLRALPRASLATRYGHHVLLRLDQALGHAPENLRPVRPRSPILVERLFDGPTDRLESIMLAARRLLDELAAKLIKAQRGILSLRVQLLRSDMDPLFLAVRTSRPCSDAPHLWKLLAPSMEKAHLGFGVEGIRFVVSSSRRAPDRQTLCWPAESEHTTDISRLIDTLHARLGPGLVARPVAVQSHLPERAFTLTPVLTPTDTPAPSPMSARYDRPTVVLDHPLPIDVTLLVPDGPLVCIRDRGSSTPVQHCMGPERVAGEWWKSSTGGRDYFKVQTLDGRWLWLFRNTAHSRWFLHGEWA